MKTKVGKGRVVLTITLLSCWLLTVGWAEERPALLYARAQLLDRDMLDTIWGGQCCQLATNQCLATHDCFVECEQDPADKDKCRECPSSPYQKAIAKTIATQACNHFDNANKVFCSKRKEGPRKADGTCKGQCANDTQLTCGPQIPNCADGGSCPKSK